MYTLYTLFLLYSGIVLFTVSGLKTKIKQRGFKNGMSTGLSEEDLDKAQKIWNYLNLNQELIKSDIIIVFGNLDPRTAEYASKLFIDGWAKWLMFSGKEGSHTKDKWPKPEAEVFQDVAVSKYGIPKNKIILETEATNTGENVKFSYEVLKSLNLLRDIKKLILVQMPHMERRVLATFMKQWPESTDNLSVVVTSPEIEMTDYPDADVGTMHDIITQTLGSLYRIKFYPKKGYQIEQDIPEEIWNCYLALKEKF